MARIPTTPMCWQVSPINSNDTTVTERGSRFAQALRGVRLGSVILPRPLLLSIMQVYDMVIWPVVSVLYANTDLDEFVETGAYALNLPGTAKPTLPFTAQAVIHACF